MASNVLGFLNDKSILVTGSTGFLGKIFVEKILRTQPGIRRIFVLLRAEDLKSAKLRFKNEVIGAELFKTLRRQHGDNFENFVFQKVVPVVGDVAADHNLGIDQESTRGHLWEILDAVVNIAASTAFDDRYDVSLNVNTRGAENVVEFAKRCPKLQILLHVSTAYVVGYGSGRIKESQLEMGVSMTTANGLDDEKCPPLSLDIEAEFGLLENTLAKLQMNSSPTASSSTGSHPHKEAIKELKELGLERAKMFGWPNTYTFTKAMGEMLLVNARGNLPLVIVRPTIIESTLADPFPGWMEGTRTMDTFIVAYGKGRLPCFMADPELILDVIPADMVVNQMLAAMATHAYENDLFIYHAASSGENPMPCSLLKDELYNYFSKNPCVSKDGKLIHVKELFFLESMSSFRLYMLQRYKVPLQVIGVVNKVISVFTARFTPRYDRMLRNYNFVMYLAELYAPYIFFQGRFDITNTERLLQKISAEDLKAFNFDVKCIDWVDYLSNVHIPGVVKYVLK